jgi:hypothetical protein
MTGNISLVRSVCNLKLLCTDNSWTSSDHYYLKGKYLWQRFNRKEKSLDRQ